MFEHYLQFSRVEIKFSLISIWFKYFFSITISILQSFGDSIELEIFLLFLFLFNKEFNGN